MDDTRDGDGYEVVAALLGLLRFCADDVSEAMISILAQTASSKWCTLPQVAQLSLRDFIRLLVAIPLGDVSETTFCEIVLSYIDRRAQAGSGLRKLSKVDEARLLQLVDTGSVAPDFVEHRLMSYLPVDSRHVLEAVLPSLQQGSYVFKCPITYYDFQVGDVYNCPCGHYVSTVGFNFMFKGRPCRECPMVGCPQTLNPSTLKKDSRMDARIAFYNQRKTTARVKALSWIASLPHHEEDEDRRVNEGDGGNNSHASSPTARANAIASASALVVGNSSKPTEVSEQAKEAVAAKFLKVIILGNAGPQFVLLPLDEECLSLTTKETMSKVLAAKGFPQTGLFVPYLPFHASGGRLDVSMVIKDYISIYFSNTPPTSGERSDFEKCCIGGALPLYIGPNYLACKSYRPLI
jgi:hypothetical protein